MQILLSRNQIVGMVSILVSRQIFRQKHTTHLIVCLQSIELSLALAAKVLLLPSKRAPCQIRLDGDSYTGTFAAYRRRLARQQSPKLDIPLWETAARLPTRLK